MAVGDENIIEEDVVKISPDLTGFRQKLEASLKTAVKGVEAKIKLVADRTGFADSIKEKVAAQQKTRSQPTFKIALRADRTGFAASIKEEVAKQQALKSQPTLKIKLVADKSGLAGTVALAGLAAKAAPGGGGKGVLGDDLDDDHDGLKKIKTDFKEIDGSTRVLATDIDRYLNGALGRSFLLSREQSRLSGQSQAIDEAANKRRQLSSEVYDAFVRRSESELAKIRDGHSSDQIRIERETEDAKVKIDRAGSNLRVKVLEQEERIKKSLEERDGRRQSSSGTISDKLQQVFGQQRLLDFGREGVRPMTALYGVLVALSPVLISVASSAVQASSSIAALGAAGIGGAAALTGLLVAFSPIVKALKLAQTTQAEGLKSSANDAATKERILDATDALGDAQRNLNKAQKDELQAQLAVNDARAQAIRDLQNLKQSVIDLNNELSGDKVSLQEAQDTQASTARNFFASRLQNLRAAQDVADAQTNLSDTTLKRAQAAQDLNKSIGQGIEGSDVVTKAKQSATDATASRQQAARQVSRAKRNVVQAGRVADPTSTAAAQLADQLKKMAPAARELYHLIHDNQKTFEALARSIQQKVLPGFNDFVRDVLKVGKDGKSSLSIFADAAGDLGGVIGVTAGKLGKLTQDKGFRSDFAKIIANNKTAMTTFGDAIVKLVPPFLKIFAASSPLLVRFADYILKISERFAAFIDKADKSGKLSEFFKRSGDELGRWADLAKQILGFLKGIFTASVGAGGSVLDKLTSFFADANTWANGPGQVGLKRFFERLANLPYAKIRVFVTNLATLFAGFGAANWALANPFFAAFGSFAASNPAAAAKLIELTTTLLTRGLGFIATHQAEAATLLAILSAYRFANRIAKIGITFPGIENLNKSLAAKFKPLDQFLGGGASTATMEVRAGVVNVYGALSGGSVAANEGSTIISGGKNGGRAEAGKAGKLSGGKGIAAIAGVALGGILAESLLDTSNKASFQNAASTTLTAALTGGALGLAFGPLGALFGSLIGAGVGAVQAAAERNALTQVKESHALTGIVRDSSTTLGTHNGINDPTVVKRDAVVNYIKARKESVAAEIASVKATQGVAAADKLQTKENKRSAETLASMLTLYDYTPAKAKAYSNAIFGVNTDLYNQQVAQDKVAAALQNTTGKADKLGASIKDLHTKLTTLDGSYIVTIIESGQKLLFNDLETALVYQDLLSKGKEATQGNIAKGRAAFDKNNAPAVNGHAAFAVGGKVPGYSPNDIADNVPAMLTAGEWVHPVAAVKHYGPQFMEAVRNRTLPRYAKGGQVWPFKVQFPKNAATVVKPPAVLGGTASGDIGVARTAEETARAMGATDKQLVALIEAGLVESGLRNLPYGDRDSKGFLQQRPSQGWGSAAQVQNVAYATRKFTLAAKARDKAGLTAGELAQLVQRSAFPDRYDQRLADAVAVLNLEAPYITSYSGVGSSGALGNSSIRGYKAMFAALHERFPEAQLFSGYRPGARTLSRNKSLHSEGRAIDVTPERKIAQWIESTYGNNVTELITPWTDLMLYHGKFHKYSKAIEDEHGVGKAGNDHIHWAMNAGGPVKARKYDTGGDLPPGYTLAYNGTGRSETVRTYQQEKQVRQPATGPTRLDRRDMVAIASYIAGATSPTVQMDGREVAKITNRYTYLPVGI